MTAAFPQRVVSCSLVDSRNEGAQVDKPSRAAQAPLQIMGIPVPIIGTVKVVDFVRIARRDRILAMCHHEVARTDRRSRSLQSLADIRPLTTHPARSLLGTMDVDESTAFTSLTNRDVNYVNPAQCVHLHPRDRLRASLQTCRSRAKRCFLPPPHAGTSAL